ncbi:MAG: hypothetical protein HYS57_02860, partial [Parcubacteria group bacterium]|nr:hypothetical protein [Parcubacteria group bacterium]
MKRVALLRFFLTQTDDPEALTTAKRLGQWGIKVSYIRIETEHLLETLKPGLNRKSHEAVRMLLEGFNRNVTTTSSLDPADGPVVRIAYRSNVVDPQTPWIIFAGRQLGLALVRTKTIKAYQLCGISHDCVEEAKKLLHNPVVEIALDRQDGRSLIEPQSFAALTPQVFDVTKCDAAELLRLSTLNDLNLSEHQIGDLIRKCLGKEPFLNRAELELYAAKTSDHCSHTTWKALGLLESLRRTTELLKHPLVLSAFVDNAGAMLFYDGYAITVKGETHNSPTSVSPYAGDQTGHGGVIRDAAAVGKGAYVIAGTKALGIGNLGVDSLPEGILHPRIILNEAVRGTADYTNPVGITMTHVRYIVHPGFTEKCLMLGHAIGIVPESCVSKGESLAGDSLIVIGGRTGRDGIHGATFSSHELKAGEGEKNVAAVQIGHPITERQILDAVSTLRDQGCIRALTDLGAGGVGVAAIELCETTGAKLDLSKMIVSTDMTDLELLISESQERLLLCVPPEKEHKALKILESFGIEGAVVGRCTNTGRFVVKHRGKTVVNKPTKFFSEVPFPVIQPVSSDVLPSSIHLLPRLGNIEQWKNAIMTVLSDFNICDQSPAGMQFDQTVGGRTVVGPYGGITGEMPHDVSVLAPLYGKPYGLVSALAMNPYYSELNPQKMAWLTLLEVCAKLAMYGVALDEVVLCNNWYTPRITKENAWKLVEATEAVQEFCRRTRIPVITGKDSSSGSRDLPIVLVSFGIGRHPDVRLMSQKSFEMAGSVLALWGDQEPDALGGSLFGRIHCARESDAREILPVRDIDQVMSRFEGLRFLQRYARSPLLSGIRA